jgi:hypothetical protein
MSANGDRGGVGQAARQASQSIARTNVGFEQLWATCRFRLFPFAFHTHEGHNPPTGEPFLVVICFSHWYPERRDRDKKKSLATTGSRSVIGINQLKADEPPAQRTSSAQ